MKLLIPLLLILVITPVSAQIKITGKAKVSARTGTGALPAAPSNLQLASHTITGATLIWTNNSTNETGIEVERSLGDAAWVLVATRPAGSTSYTDGSATAITRNNPLRWRVRAVNNSGESAPTDPVYNTLPPSPLGTYSTSWTAIFPTSAFPRPTKPARGGWVYDPLYGAKMIRVTNESTTDSNGTVYSYYSSFNADNTKVLEYTNSGGLIHTFVTNPALGLPYITSSFRLPNIPGDGSDGFFGGSSPIWDATDPDILYAAGAQKVYKYVVSTNTWSLYADASSLISAVCATCYIQQWQVEDNHNPRRFGFQVYSAGPVDHGCMVIQKDISTTSTTLTYSRPADTPVAVNEVTISKNGDYFVLAYFDTGLSVPTDGAMRVIALNQPGQPDTLVEKDDYAANGHYDLTDTDIYGPDDFHADLLKIPLTNPGQGAANTYRDLSYIPDFGAYHTSCRAEDSVGWFELSFHFTPTGARALDGELVLVSMSGANVRRFGHHFGDPDHGGYYDTTRANLSRDGKFDAFTSDWGQPGVRRDMFIALTSL